MRLSMIYYLSVKRLRSLNSVKQGTPHAGNPVLNGLEINLNAKRLEVSPYRTIILPRKRDSADNSSDDDIV